MNNKTSKTKLGPIDNKRKLTIFLIYMVMYYISSVYIMKHPTSIIEALLGALIFTLIYSHYVNKQLEKIKKQ